MRGELNPRTVLRISPLIFFLKKERSEGFPPSEFNIMVVNPEVMRSLEKPTCRWDDNIKANLTETGREDMDCILLGHRGVKGAHLNTKINLD
jgi:hypothetical protein